MILRTRCVLAASAAALATAAATSAAIIELEAEGLITSVSGAFAAPLDTVAPGQPWLITLRYDTDTAPVSSSPTTASYFPVTQINVSVDGADVTPFGVASGTIAAIANDFESADPTRDRDEISFAFADDIDVALGMIDYDQTALDSTELPTDLDFPAFDESAFIIRSGSSMDDSRIEGAVDNVSLTIIPAPGTAAILMLAPFGLRRRR